MNRPDAHPEASTALRIAGGRVIDPANGVDAVHDLCVHRGRTVDALPDDVPYETIDATGRLVMPGAIDMHTHIASRGVAIAHELAPDIVPCPRATALRYLQMGYTTLMDAAVPPEDTAVAQRTFEAMPIVDTGFLLELGTHDEVINTLAHHSEAAAIELIDNLITGHGAFGLKLVSLRHSAGLDAALNETHITARQLIRFAAEAAEHLPIAHPVHLHVPDLGAPDNVTNTIEALEALQGHRAHLAHAQFYAYRQDDNDALCSGATQLAQYLAAHPNVTTDAGCIAIGPAMMITRDHPLGERLATLTGSAMTQREGWSIMPMQYAAKNPVNAVQWATGLELILCTEDLTRLALSVDHPNGAPFTAMPHLMALLANRDARRDALQTMHHAATRRTGLATIERELTDSELVTLTRVAPARSLGLDDRGHLGAGALADIVIADRVWSQPTTVVKSGVTVIEDGVVTRECAGERLCAVAKSDTTEAR